MRKKEGQQQLLEEVKRKCIKERLEEILKEKRQKGENGGGWSLNNRKDGERMKETECHIVHNLTESEKGQAKKKKKKNQTQKGWKSLTKIVEEKIEIKNIEQKLFDKAR